MLCATRKWIPAYRHGSPLALSSDLVDLEQHGIARFPIIRLLHVFCVRNQQIITNQFNFAFFVEFSPAVPVILCKGVF
jgi:hypothetical protein